MSNIGGLGNSNVPLPSTDRQATQEVKTTSNAATANAPVDTTEAVPAQNPATTMENLLPPVSVPDYQFDDNYAQGAASFVVSLRDVNLSRTGEGVLVEFLKLMMLTESFDNKNEALKNLGKRNLRHSAHGEASMANVFFSNQIRAGTEGVGSALSDAAAMNQARNDLLALMSGERPDIQGKFDALVEIDQYRNRIADLVLDVIDKHVETAKLTRGGVRL